MMKTVFVGFKFLQMGCHSGYDVIRQHAQYDVIVDCQKDYNRLQTFLGNNSVVSRIYVRLCGSRLWWVELRCLVMALRHRELAFHFIYAENIYRYLGWFKWLGFRIICTYHQPIAFFEKYPSYLRGVRKTDCIIVLSEDLLPSFKCWKGDNRVFYIPHGVDVDYFCPDHSVTRQRQILMVGNWLREFEFADQILARVLDEDPLVEVYVVANKENLFKFRHHERLHLLSGISDDELLYRYRSASLLFLPLAGFVANNAVLEAFAVGCPLLVASDQEIGANPKDLIECVPLESEIVVKRIRELLDDEDHASNMRRNWVVQHFGWQVIGNKTGSVHAGVHNA